MVGDASKASREWTGEIHKCLKPREMHRAHNSGGSIAFFGFFGQFLSFPLVMLEGSHVGPPIPLLACPDIAV